MTIEEFSNEFDVLLKQQAASFGLQGITALDEYEKSIFLTKAQEQIVISLYNGHNSQGISFEGSEELRRSLDSLIVTFETTEQLQNRVGLSSTSVFYTIPSEVWFLTYESAILTDNKLQGNTVKVSVLPVTQDQYYRINRNPFRKSNQRRILRLDAGNHIVELISDYTISKYLIRYLRKPSPIILLPLDNLSIDSINTITECELNPVIHRTILERAVTLALQNIMQNAGK